MDIKELDRLAIKLMSIYTRTKDADFSGYVNCFTCPRGDHWSNMHCGHFVKRAHRCTRFMEANNNPQCPICNVSYDGRPKEYAKQLDKKFGKGMAEYLQQLGRETCKTSRMDYIELITTLDEKLNGKEADW